MRKFLQRGDEAFFFDNEEMPVIVADDVLSCWAIGNDVHVIYGQNRPAFVDGILQTRRKPVGCLIINAGGLRRGRQIITPVVETIPHYEDKPFWLGALAN